MRNMYDKYDAFANTIKYYRSIHIMFLVINHRKGGSSKHKVDKIWVLFFHVFALEEFFN